MTAAKTPEERERNARYQREFRKRKESEGLAEVRGIFAYPDEAKKIKEYAEKLARKRKP